MTSPDLPIETDRLLLRYFEKSDLDAIAAYCGRAQVRRYLDGKARDHAEFKAILNTMSSQRRLTRPGDALTLAIVRRGHDDVIGHVSLRWTDATAGQAELFFILNPRFRNQGFTTEAIRAVLDLGFDLYGFHRVFARCGAEAHNSVRLLKRLGMRLEAHYREHALFQGDWDEELQFAVLDREWQRSAKVKEIGGRLVA